MDLAKNEFGQFGKFTEMAISHNSIDLLAFVSHFYANVNTSPISRLTAKKKKENEWSVFLK